VFKVRMELNDVVDFILDPINYIYTSEEDKQFLIDRWKEMRAELERLHDEIEERLKNV
jgi:hypothetical protein